MTDEVSWNPARTFRSLSGGGNVRRNKNSLPRADRRESDWKGRRRLLAVLVFLLLLVLVVRRADALALLAFFGIVHALLLRIVMCVLVLRVIRVLTLLRRLVLMAVLHILPALFVLHGLKSLRSLDASVWRRSRANIAFSRP